MKKLLSILAATGLIATSTTSAVACGKKDDNVVENPIDLSSVILKFKEEVRVEIVKHLKALQANLFVEDTKTIEDNFLGRPSLEKLKQGDIGPSLTPDQKNKLAQEFHELMKINELETKINSIANREEYSIILSDKPFGEIVFDNKINFLKNGAGDKFNANVIFDFEFQIFYKKSPEITEKIDGLTRTFKYFLTSDDKFYEVIRNTIPKTIKEKIVNPGIDYETDLKRRTSKTKLEDLTQEMQDFYNDKASKLRTELPPKIEKEYFNGKKGLDGVKLSFSDEKIVEIDKDDWIFKYRSKKNNESYNKHIPTNKDIVIDLLTSHEKYIDDSKRKEEALNSKLRQALKLIYREELKKDDQKSIDKIVKILNQEIEESNGNEYTNLEDEFFENIRSKFSALEFNKIGESWQSWITQIGTMTVNNLQATFPGSGNKYELPVPLGMYVSYLPIMAKTNDFRKSENFKKEIAKNILTGILGFRDAYGIIGYSGIRNDDARSKVSLINKNADLFKHWGQWKEGDSLEDINAQINLEGSEALEKIKEKFYKESKQNHFYYSFVGTGKNKAYDIEGHLGDILLKPHKRKLSDNKDSIWNFQFEMDYFRIQFEYDTKILEGLPIWLKDTTK